MTGYQVINQHYNCGGMNVCIHTKNNVLQNILLLIIYAVHDQFSLKIHWIAANVLDVKKRETKKKKTEAKKT